MHRDVRQRRYALVGAADLWAYDRQSHVGRLDKALDEAKRRGWTVVDMKTDWKQIFAFE